MTTRFLCRVKHVLRLAERGSYMEHDLNKVLKDICYIKDTIEKAKVHYRGFAKTGILFGIYHLAESVLNFLSMYVSGFIYMISILKMVFLVSFLGCYIYIYRQEKRYRNQYYLSLFCIWGTLGVAIPVMLLISNLICFVIQKDCLIGSTSVSADMILFAVFLIVCAYVSERRNLICVSYGILLCYFLLSVVWSEQGIGISVPMSANAILSFSFIYEVIVVSGGYICMGIYLWKRENDDN